jgi:hypothetical protein
MNKIQVLIDNGFITDDDIQQYISSNQEHNEQEEFNDEWFEERNFYGTDYVLASTNHIMEETMVFPSNEQGEIVSYSEMSNLALRYGHDDWEDAMAAVITLNTDEYKYIHVKTLNGGNNIHNLFRRINVLETIVI